MIDPQIMTILLTVLGTVIWGIRQEGRINQTQQKVADSEKFFDAKIDGVKELIEAKADATNSRLERIERALNGSLRGH